MRDIISSSSLNFVLNMSIRLCQAKILVEGGPPSTKKSANINVLTYSLGYVSGYGCFFYVYVICKYVIRTLPVLTCMGVKNPVVPPWPTTIRTIQF